MKKIINKKNITYIIIITTILLLILLVNKSPSIKSYSNDLLSFNYDSNWKLNKKDSNTYLSHNDSKISIKTKTLTDESRYEKASSFTEELLNSIQEQNTTYKLIYKENVKLTEKNYDGLKALYEDGENQAAIYVIKSFDKFIVISYYSPNKYFDILLDSVESIIYSLEIKEETYNLTYDLNIKTSLVKLTNNDINLGENISYNIASNHCLVNYSIPINFKRKEYNSNYQIFSYSNINDTSSGISLNTELLNVNIYDYINPDKSYSTVYKNYSFSKNSSNYMNFEENIDKYESNYTSYIYKNSYTYLNVKNENIELIYGVDNSHTFIIKLSSRDIEISKKLIDKISINKVMKYATYTDRELDNNQQIVKLSTIVNNKERKISISLPTLYVEVNKNNNIYESRYFNLEYLNNKNTYKYNIDYKIYNSATLAIDDINFSIKQGKQYGSIELLQESNQESFNNKEFKVYYGTSFYLSEDIYGKPITIKENYKVLIYELDNGVLVITLKGNDVEVSDSIVSDATNFNIEFKEL